MTDDTRTPDPLTHFLDKYGLANTSGERHVRRKAALAEARAALVARPAPDSGLDVERLARALPDYLLDTENGILPREPIAQQIAAAYTRLTEANHE